MESPWVLNALGPPCLVCRSVGRSLTAVWVSLTLLFYRCDTETGNAEPSQWQTWFPQLPWRDLRVKHSRHLLLCPLSGLQPLLLG